VATPAKRSRSPDASHRTREAAAVRRGVLGVQDRRPSFSTAFYGAPPTSAEDIYRLWGAIGTCFDNALMESFWSRVQVEVLDRQSWSTRLELATALFEYLEIFHNRQRRHSSLAMLTPIEYEARHGSNTPSAAA
jgi:hypothetical protein